MTDILLIIGISASCLALVANIIAVIYYAKIMPKDNGVKVAHIAQKAIKLKKKLDKLNASIIGGVQNEK